MVAVGDKITAADKNNQLDAVTGTVTIACTAANTPTSGTATFGVTFASPPVVQVTANTTVPGTGVSGVAVTGITNTSCSIWVTRNSTSPTALLWAAFGDIL